MRTFFPLLLLGLVVVPTTLAFASTTRAHAGFARARRARGDGDGDGGFDPVALIGCDFMGFPREQKWKGVRIATYAFAAGSMAPDAWQELVEAQRSFAERASEILDALPMAS